MSKQNSKYYRLKADKIFMSQFHGLPCEVCGKTEGTAGHHVVGKRRSRALKYDKRNIVVLCQGHHTFSNDMAPHSTNQMAVVRFGEWFKIAFPDRHQWIQENEYITRKYTFKQACENMEAGRLAWE